MIGSDVEIPRQSGANMPGYAALPATPQRAVVVIHEILGRQPEIDRVVERFAAAGYAAVAPDLFHAGSRIGCIRRSLATIDSGEGPMADGIFAAQRWLCERTGLGPAQVGEIHTFPTVGHSFLTDGDHPVLAALTRPLMQVRYDPSVAEDAWQKILAFFDRTLPA